MALGQRRPLRLAGRSGRSQTVLLLAYSLITTALLVHQATQKGEKVKHWATWFLQVAGDILGWCVDAAEATMQQRRTRMQQRLHQQCRRRRCCRCRSAPPALLPACAQRLAVCSPCSLADQQRSGNCCQGHTCGEPGECRGEARFGGHRYGAQHTTAACGRPVPSRCVPTSTCRDPTLPAAAVPRLPRMRRICSSGGRCGRQQQQQQRLAGRVCRRRVCAPRQPAGDAWTQWVLAAGCWLTGAG